VSTAPHSPQDAPPTDTSSTPTPEPGPPTEPIPSQDAPADPDPVIYWRAVALRAAARIKKMGRELAEREQEIACLRAELAARATPLPPADPDDCDQETMAPGPFRWRIGGKDCDDVEAG